MHLQQILLKKVVENFEGKSKYIYKDYIEIIPDLPETIIQKIITEITPYQLEKLKITNDFLENFIKNRWKDILKNTIKYNIKSNKDYCQLYFQNLITDKMNEETTNLQTKTKDLKRLVSEYGKYVYKLSLWRTINKSFYSVIIYN